MLLVDAKRSNLKFDFEYLAVLVIFATFDTQGHAIHSQAVLLLLRQLRLLRSHIACEKGLKQKGPKRLRTSSSSAPNKRAETAADIVIIIISIIIIIIIVFIYY